MDEEKVYLVKLNGIYREEAMARMRLRFEKELGGKVVIVDSRVEDVVQLKPQDADALVKLLAGDDWKDMEEES